MPHQPLLLGLLRTLVRSASHTPPPFCAHRRFHPTQPSATRLPFLDWLAPPLFGPPPDDSELLKDYHRLRAQRVRYPYLQPPLDHPTLSRLLQRLVPLDPARTIEIYEDLEHVWGSAPTEEDHVCYLSAALAEGRPLDAKECEKVRIPLLERSRSYAEGLSIVQDARGEAETAHLIRLAIKDGLEDERKRLVEDAAANGVHKGLLVHGALLVVDDRSLDYVCSQLEAGAKLEGWIERNLVERLSIRDEDRGALMGVLARLCAHGRRQRALSLVECALNQMGPSLKSSEQVRALADSLRETTNIDIFRDAPDQLAGQLFERAGAGEELGASWAWHRLAKERGGRVVGRCMTSVLGFKDELLRTPEWIEELWADFRSASRARTLSPADLSACALSFLQLAVQSRRPAFAQAVLQELRRDTKKPGAWLLGSEAVLELIEPLLELALTRDEAYEFYEQLVWLGRPQAEFFVRFLRRFLQRCESPGLGERAQALTMPRLMAILEHMSVAGARPDSQTYTILLNHYSTIVRANPRNLSTRLQLERIHTLIKLDVELEPDSQLLHQLLKAFSYNGLYAKAWAVWDRLSTETHLRREMTNASLATMFDLAGYESERYGDGRLNTRAIEAWKMLREQTGGSRRWARCGLNKNVWDSWVECLARSRRVSEACKVVFEEMKPLAVGVDERTLSILLRFARREEEIGKQYGITPNGEGLLEGIRERIKKEFPDLWTAVSDQGLTASEIGSQKSVQSHETLVAGQRTLVDNPKKSILKG